MPEAKLTHLDEQGNARMVDVGAKAVTRRRAVARGEIRMHAETLKLIQQGGVPKGDVLAVARVAGVMAAKRTSELIPLCHPLGLDAVEVQFRFLEDPTPAVEIEASAALSGRTGVEMEALAAVSVAALTVYDMCKAVDQEMTIDRVRLVLKEGGRSGVFRRDGETFNRSDLETG